MSESSYSLSIHEQFNYNLVNIISNLFQRGLEVDVGPGRRPLAAPARRVRLHAGVAPLARLKRAFRGKRKNWIVLNIVINTGLAAVTV